MNVIVEMKRTEREATANIWAPRLLQGFSMKSHIEDLEMTIFKMISIASHT